MNIKNCLNGRMTFFSITFYKLMIMAQEELIDILKGVKKHPRLFLDSEGYGPLVNFLNGFEIGFLVSLFGENKIKVRDWMIKKLGRHFSLSLSAYVLKEMAEGDEAKAFDLLCDVYIEYFESLSSSKN